MYELSFVITLPSHVAKSNKTNNAIHCWKYSHDQSRVDYHLFYHNQIDQAIDYLITPFPSLQWSITLTE